MVSDNVKEALYRYNQLAELILEQKLDEYSEMIENMTLENDEDLSVEAFIQRKAKEETELISIECQDEVDPKLDNKSMRDYFLSLDVDSLLETMEYATKNIDVSLPISLIDAICTNSKKDNYDIISYCTKVINDASFVEEELKDENLIFEMEFLNVKACFELLTAMEDSSLIKTVLDRFLSYDKTKDYVADAIASYIVSFPEVSTPLLISKIEEGIEKELLGPYEDVIIMLSNIGKDNKSEEIYFALRSAFRYMRNKIYAVICLADYGDPRAIPMFKNFINRHQKTIGRELFYELMSSIQKLGGDISDISDPFGDFTNKK